MNKTTENLISFFCGFYAINAIRLCVAFTIYVHDIDLAIYYARQINITIPYEMVNPQNELYMREYNCDSQNIFDFDIYVLCLPFMFGTIITIIK